MTNIMSRGFSALRCVVRSQAALRASSTLSSTTGGRGPNQSRGHMVMEGSESAEQYDARMLAFFKRPDIDGWDIRRGLQELHINDNVPEPEIVIAALHAIRRVNDHSLAVRFLETLKDQSQMDKAIWPWMQEQLKPTLQELGIASLEEMGYDKPELALKDSCEIHG